MQLIITVALIGFLIFVFMLDGDVKKIGFGKSKSASSDDNTKSNNKSNSKSSVSIGKNVKNTQDELPFSKIITNGNATNPALILKDATTYVGVLEVTGVNYNLLSVGEKLTLEEVFQKTLNGLDYPIQLFVQSRKINLDNYILLYENRLEEIKGILKKEENKLALYSNKDTNIDEIKLIQSNIRRISSQLVYGANVINFIQQFAMNEDILDKKYFIITPYYYDSTQFNIVQTDDEKFATAFNTIYNRLDGILGSLRASNLDGRVLNGIEVAELLYTSFNKGDSDKYKITNALRSDFTSFITTARPVEYKIIDEERRKLNEEYERELLKINEEYENEMNKIS